MPPSFSSRFPYQGTPWNCSSLCKQDCHFRCRRCYHSDYYRVHSLFFFFGGHGLSWHRCRVGSGLCRSKDEPQPLHVGRRHYGGSALLGYRPILRRPWYSLRASHPYDVDCSHRSGVGSCSTVARAAVEEETKTSTCCHRMPCCLAVCGSLHYIYRYYGVADRGGIRLHGQCLLFGSNRNLLINGILRNHRCSRCSMLPR
mmetsp:Transcript_36296/g.79437  ORF Transcript_36296/g.79437 Transcript_36296/m.79437 type:complete len:200 (+) Transcript_36296:5983-6582(+)